MKRITPVSKLRLKVPFLFEGEATGEPGIRALLIALAIRAFLFLVLLAFVYGLGLVDFAALGSKVVQKL